MLQLFLATTRPLRKHPAAVLDAARRQEADRAAVDGGEHVDPMPE